MLIGVHGITLKMPVFIALQADEIKKKGRFKHPAESTAQRPDDARIFIPCLRRVAAAQSVQQRT